MRRIAFIVSVLALAAACHSTPAPAHDALAAPTPAALSNGVSSCAVYGEVKDGHRCQVYDTKAKAFAPSDSLTNRVYLYERWLDLYNTVERQVVVRNLTEAMAPGDPESRWSDEKYLRYYDDTGDSAGFGDDAQNGAAFRYAVTGTDADYQRLESYVRGAVMQWDATGMDGYLARFHYAGVPPGTPLLNGHAMKVRDDDDPTFDIPASALDQMPAYYRSGLDIQGKHVAVRPGWEGHVSIDAYSGPMNAWPVAYGLLKDPALKARMARHYSCFLKRLRILKITNLSKNAQLQAEVAKYLTSNILHLDADDPDLTKTDTIYGFYLPQYNSLSAATYPRECPAQLARDATEADTVDVTQVGWEGKLLTQISRQSQSSDQKDSVEFAYYVSVRAGDAVMLESYALSAYRMTGDPAFLRWRDEVLIGKANAREVSRTIGAFLPPKPCRSYYRTPNVYMAHFVRLLTDGDPDSHAFAVDIWKRKFAAKEVAGLGDPLFEVLSAGYLQARTAATTDLLAQLASFGGTADHLDDPRRNYALDSTVHPPAGVTIAEAPAADLKICTTPVTVLGVAVPTGDPPDPHALYSDVAMPLMARPPDNWQWEKDPFRPVRAPGDAGMQQYPGLDLTELYWIARYYKLLPDAHAVLAWGPL